MREVDGQPVEKWKVPGETAIPRGVYRLTLEASPKFGPDTPSLHNVPGFKWIRIHAGNRPEDTEGCIIVGYKLSKEGLVVPGSTRPALSDLKAQLKAVSSEIKIQVV